MNAHIELLAVVNALSALDAGVRSSTVYASPCAVAFVFRGQRVDLATEGPGHLAALFGGKGGRLVTFRARSPKARATMAVRTISEQ